MYIIILYHIDFYHDFYVSIHRNFWGSMFQFTEIAGENNYSISGWIIVNIAPNTRLSMNLPLSGQISIIQCTLYFETISSKLLKYVVNLLRHIYGTNVHARWFTNKVKNRYAQCVHASTLLVECGITVPSVWSDTIPAFPQLKAISF